MSQRGNACFSSQHLGLCAQLKHGTAESANKVAQACVAAEPHHGDRWQVVAKDLQNAHKALDVILRKVVAHMDKEAPP